jgi:hypothetical protein
MEVIPARDFIVVAFLVAVLLIDVDVDLSFVIRVVVFLGVVDFGVLLVVVVVFFVEVVVIVFVLAVATFDVVVIGIVFVVVVLLYFLQKPLDSHLSNLSVTFPKAWNMYSFATNLMNLGKFFFWRCKHESAHHARVISSSKDVW